MYESISTNNELENEMTLDMSYFWYSDVTKGLLQFCACDYVAWPTLWMQPIGGTRWKALRS